MDPYREAPKREYVATVMSLHQGKEKWTDPALRQPPGDGWRLLATHVVSGGEIAPDDYWYPAVVAIWEREG